MDISYFFGAAAGGFVLMAAITIQALVAICCSIPLAKQAKKEHEEFQLIKACQRAIRVALIVSVVTVIATLFVHTFAPDSIIYG